MRLFLVNETVLSEQNETQVFDMVKSPDFPSQNMEEKSVSDGELHAVYPGKFFQRLKIILLLI